MSYSTDLRERIVDTVLNKGMTLQKTAETFNVSKSSVERYLHQSSPDCSVVSSKQVKHR